MFKKFLLIGVVVIVSGGLIWKFYPAKTAIAVDPNDVITVSTGSIQNSIDLVAKVALVDKDTLLFKQSGKIANIDVKEGATVKQWQVLASLDLKQALLDIESQKIGVANAKLALTKLYDSFGDTQKLQSKNAAEEAVRKLDSLRLDLASLQREKTQALANQDNLIAEANKNLDVTQKKIDSLKINVEYAKQSEAETIAQTQATGDSRIKSTQSNAQSLVADLKDSTDTYKKILSVDNPNNTGFMQLGTSQLRSDATFQYTGFLENQQNLQKALDSFDPKTASIADAQALANLTSDIANKASGFNTLVKNLIDATTAGSSYSETTLNSYRSTLTSYSNKFLGWVTTASSNIKDLLSGSSVSTIQLSTQSSLISNEASLASSELDLLKQKNSLAQLVADKKKQSLDYEGKIQADMISIESAKATIGLSQKQYQDLIAGPKATDIEQAKNNIRQSENTLASMQDKIKDYQIISPMDGTVSAISIHAGNMTDSTGGITVENRNTIQLTALTDQSQVVRIKSDSPVKVTFDSYKRRPFDAKVSFVQAVPVETSGVVSYTVKFVMQKPEGVELYDGMTASAKIITDSVENVVTIPLGAVQNDNSGRFVQAYNDGKLSRQDIETGKSDSTHIEIQSGLTPGQQIVIRPYTATASGTSGSGSSNSFIRFPGVGGGGNRGAGGGSAGGGNFRSGGGGGGAGGGG